MRRHKHNLSHYRLFTGDMGNLIPIGLLEVLPGDTFRHSTSLLMRCSPLLAPVMHRVDVRIHHFFVPNRLVWDQWEDFITGSEELTIPQIEVPGNSLLADYYGLSAPGDNNETVNALPIAGYNLIWNEFYRDQDLSNEVPLQVFPEDPAPVSRHKDYFTAARPWPQKGDPVTIPLGDTAPLIAGVNNVAQELLGLTSGNVQDMETNELDGSSRVSLAAGDDNGPKLNDTEKVAIQPSSFVNALQVDLSDAVSADVRDVRLAFALQRYQEARARYGSRYTEYLRYLGVKSSDSRLQRPEYLGGGKQTISFSEVLQTAEGSDPVGEMRGHGIAALRSNRYQRFFEEHGYVHSFVSILPRNVYDRSTSRHWLKLDKEDYYQRELQDIGHQEVYTGELDFQHSSGLRETFGYSPRYSEYFSERSRVSGDFHDVLDYWHLARKNLQDAVLNASFIYQPVTKRIFAEQTQHSLWCAARHSVGARRLVRKSNVGRII